MRRLLAPIGLLAAVAALSAPGPAHAQAPAAPASCFAFDVLGGDASELLEGTSGPDHVAGFGGVDDIVTFGGEDCASGGAGDDRVRLGPADDDGFGRSGGDLLEGGPGRDALAGGPGPDVVRGDQDDDLLRDEPGDRDPDELDGGPGDDVLHAGAGGDALLGGPGDDVLHAANGAVDRVDCGEGFDRAFADAGDALAGCERPVFGYRPVVRRSPQAGSARTAFTLHWDRGGPAGRRVVELAGHPAPDAGCRVGSWRVRVRARGASLRWRGDRPPCAGRYAWRVAAVATGAADRIDCERRAEREAAKGAPPELGCARREVVGETAFRVVGR
jgi:hypothetical protein